MSEHTFTAWLRFEVDAARCALLRLYEEEARLKFIEGPRLEKEYMEAIGSYEESIIQEEMECELLTVRQRLIQAAFNRREAIDEAAIDKQIEALRRDMEASAAGDPPPQPYALLSSEQSNELQEIFSRLVKQFHPGMHPELTDTERQLYQKAQEAYRMRDLPTLRLIWEMLTASDGQGLQLAFEMSMNMQAGGGSGAPDRDYSTDYSLASALYSSFVPLQEEAAIYEEWQRYTQRTASMMEQLQAMRQLFPYSAEEMLTDPQQLQAYRQELEQRMSSAQRKREQLTWEIEQMTGGARAGG